MPKPFARLAILSIASIAVLVPASSTRATTFEDISLEQLAAASDLVVIGRVEHVDVHPTGPGGQPGIHTRAVVQVAETLRGEHQTIIEVWVHGGRLGDRVRIVSGQATFQPGEDVVLFLFRAGGGLWPTGMGRGKWTVSDPNGHPVAVPQSQLSVRSSRPTSVELSDLRASIAGASRPDATTRSGARP